MISYQNSKQILKKGIIKIQNESIMCSVLPNPTTKNITVKLEENYNNIAIEVLNMMGQVILSKDLPRTISVN